MINERNVRKYNNSNKGRRRKKRQLKWATINARSLVNKMDLLKYEAEEHSLKIISVTETWGKEKIADCHFEMKEENYKMYRNDRNVKKGGGAILYVSSDIEQRPCRPLNTGGYESSAWCWIIEKGGKKILVGSIYRSTSSTPENDTLLLKKIDQAYEIAGDNRLLLLGDFNVPGIDWKDKDLKRGATRIDELMLDVMNDCFLHQHVKEDTRFMNEQSSTLDLVFTKEERDVRNVELQPPLAGSDHAIVMGDFVTEWKSRVIQKSRRLFHKGDYKSINDGLVSIDWDVEFESKSVETCMGFLGSKLEALVDEHIPMSTPKD